MNFEVTIPNETACEGCGEPVAVELDVCPGCGADTYRMTFPQFYSDLEQFKMMDGRYGGLVLGRGDPSDDIPMYICREGGVYTLVGMMQGGEYLMSRAATMKHGSRLELLNSDKGEVGEIDFHLTSSSSVINTNFIPPFGGLWITETQFIVNRYATMLHFSELDCMNSEANYEFAKSLSPVISTV